MRYLATQSPTPALPQSPRLTVCMIVRDSARTLPDCLASIRPWVDELIVVDTGSVDNTPQIAASFGARLGHFPWVDDFSAARNVSFELARGQWLFWMDSDDTIDELNGRKLRELAYADHDPKVLGYVVQVHCPGFARDEHSQLTVVDHVKLIRNHPQLRFEGRIHEQILPAIRRLGGEVAWTNIYVVHSGSDQSPEGRQRKYDRDLRILYLDLEERPNHPFVLFNLGMTYGDIGESSLAEQWLRRCLSVSAPNESHVRKAYALLVGSLMELGRFREAWTVCDAGLSLYPRDAELVFRRGMLAHGFGELDEAICAYRSIFHQPDDRHFTSIDAGIGGFKTRHNLALAYAQRGNADLAELQFRTALREVPWHRAARQGLAQSLIDQRKFATISLLVEELSGSPTTKSDAQWILAEQSRIDGHLGECRVLLEDALNVDADNLLVRRALCRWLFEHGQPDEAEVALLELIRRVSDDATAYHNLGLLHARSGQLAAAAEALERSLELRPESDSTQTELARVQAAIAASQGQDSAAFFAGPSDTINAQTRELPPCAARRRIEDKTDTYFCLHPQVHVTNQLVTADVCFCCSRWQEPMSGLRDLAALERRLRGSCEHLGSEVGLRDCPDCTGHVQVKVFACLHPSHVETTLEQCRVCPDFVPAVVARGKQHIDANCSR